ncbi:MULTISPECIES: phenylacetate--CoA ligase family protein [Spirosoma]|uniref:Phenylacetate--CoA ligase family protein n=1 Tax=Spirosoma sordidisoli TaxID=2502893 RepID=A0A4Q2ULT1_9BACT|nr:MULTISPECIES: AMP-binding protein [Spirosoma]RYC68465.1 phenylacetate--CoA ligase family protein [Spirosoma sordidisoli]
MSKHRFLPDLETASPDQSRQWQAQQLVRLLRYVRRHSPYYQRVFRTQGLSIDAIRTLNDLTQLPVTTKTDLQLHNADFLCVPRSRIVDYVNTSGSLGSAVSVALTERDLKRLAYNEALSLACADGSRSDVYQLTTTLDKRFMAGMAYFMGIRKLGAGVIRTGSGLPGMQWDTIAQIQPTALIAVPSFVVTMLDYAEANGIDYAASSIRKIVCVGENLRTAGFGLNALGRRIQDRWPQVRLYSTYASTEMGAAFTECTHGQGGHHHPELLIIELLDANNQPVGPGEYGELTITTLGVEGMPLLRFKTGDICQLHTEPCACGRTTARISPIAGRKQQMLKVKGTTLFPQAIYDVLNELPAVENYQIEVHSNVLDLDEVTVNLGLREPSDWLVEQIRHRLTARLRVTPALKTYSPADVHQRLFTGYSRKPRIFVDHRSNLLV